MASGSWGGALAGVACVAACAPLLATTTARADPWSWRLRLGPEVSSLRRPIAYNLSATTDDAAFSAQVRSSRHISGLYGGSIDTALMAEIVPALSLGPHLRLGYGWASKPLEHTVVTTIDEYEVRGGSRWFGVGIGPELQLARERLVLAPGIGVGLTSDRGDFQGATLGGAFVTRQWRGNLHLTAGPRLPVTPFAAVVLLGIAEWSYMPFFEDPAWRVGLLLGLDLKKELGS